MATGTFGTAINCMDGRVQTPIADWVKMHFSVTWVDMITEAGADGILANSPCHVRIAPTRTSARVRTARPTSSSRSTSARTSRCRLMARA